MLKVTSNVLNASDCSEVAILALLDLSAAFDTVDHCILLQHLHETCGLRGTVLTWIRCFLSDRNRLVSFFGVKYPIVKATCGIPQASVLGPLSFVYILLMLSDIRH